MYFRSKTDSNFVLAYLGFGINSESFRGICIQGCDDTDVVQDDWLIDDFELI
jgi:hypothetical protein